jgi:hypothetical protein
MEGFDMRIRSAVTALAAISLATAPLVAEAAPAAVEQARVGGEVEGESLRGGLLLPLAALIAAILAVILLTDGGDEPASP